jgi:hypothetical protein
MLDGSLVRGSRPSTVGADLGNEPIVDGHADIRVSQCLPASLRIHAGYAFFLLAHQFVGVVSQIGVGGNYGS